MDLFNDLQDLIRKLNQAINLLGKYGNEYAETEKNYKITLRQEALKLRTDGMAITLINQIVYGIPEVADKRFKRDVAEAMYKTALENINSLKLQIRVMENQISREWGHNEN